MWHSEKEELGYERICFILKTEKKRKGSDGKDECCGDTKGFQPKELDRPIQLQLCRQGREKKPHPKWKLGGPGRRRHSVLPIEQGRAPISLKSWFGFRCDDGALDRNLWSSNSSR